MEDSSEHDQQDFSMAIEQQLRQWHPSVVSTGEEDPDKVSRHQDRNVTLQFEHCRNISVKDLRRFQEAVESLFCRTARDDGQPLHRRIHLHWEDCTFEPGALSQLIATFSITTSTISFPPYNPNNSLPPPSTTTRASLFHSLHFTCHDNTNTIRLAEAQKLIQAAYDSLQYFHIQVVCDHWTMAIEHNPLSFSRTNRRSTTHDAHSRLDMIVAPNERTMNDSETSIFLDSAFLQQWGDEILAHLPAPLHSLHVGPCQVVSSQTGDENSSSLSLLNQALAKCRYTIHTLTLAVRGQSHCASQELSMVGFLREIPPSIHHLELLMSNMPLFLSNNDNNDNDDERFARALSSAPLSILGMDNVGLTQRSFVKIMRAVAALPVVSGLHLWLSGNGFFGRDAFQTLVQVLPNLQHIETLSIVDREPLPPFDSHGSVSNNQSLNQLLLDALYANTSLHYVNVDVGWVLCGGDSAWNEVAALWKRNELISSANKALSNMNHQSSLLPLLLHRVQSLDSGVDAAHFMVKQVLWKQLGFYNFAN